MTCNDFLLAAVIPTCGTRSFASLHYCSNFYPLIMPYDSALEEAFEALVMSAAKHWPGFVFRGIVQLLFGLLLVIYPNATIFTITRVFGAFMIIDGVFCLLAVVLLCRNGATCRLWSPYMLASVASIVLGSGSLAYPDMTVDALFIITGCWFLIVGLSELAVACILRKGLSNACSGCMIIGGTLYVVFAIALLANPAAAVSTLARIAGVFIMLFGLEVTFFGIELRSIKNNDGDAANVSMV